MALETKDGKTVGQKIRILEMEKAFEEIDKHIKEAGDKAIIVIGGPDNVITGHVMEEFVLRTKHDIAKFNRSLRKLEMNNGAKLHFRAAHIHNLNTWRQVRTSMLYFFDYFNCYEGCVKYSTTLCSLEPNGGIIKTY